MEEQEDISQLVIGMTGNSVFNELFAGAQGLSGEGLNAWFDQATATLGGRDIVETVRDLLGNVARFDFQQVGKDLPKVDLPDLEKFFSQAVSRHGRRVFRRDNGLEIKTPDEWKARSYAVRDKYEGLVFDRSLRGTNAASRVLGVGHILFDIALDEARGLPECVTALDGLSAPLLIVSVEDEVTGTGASVHRMVFGVTEQEGSDTVLRDWEALQLLNSISIRTPVESPQAADSGEVVAVVQRLTRFIELELAKHTPTMVRPMAWPELLFLPRLPER
jgi:hypothetical protein